MTVKILMALAFLLGVVAIGNAHFWACNQDPPVKPDDKVELMFKYLPELKR